MIEQAFYLVTQALGGCVIAFLLTVAAALFVYAAPSIFRELTRPKGYHEFFSIETEGE